MLVAIGDQLSGTSTSGCSNTASPSSPLIFAVRFSQRTVAYTSSPARVKCRWIGISRTCGRQSLRRHRLLLRHSTPPSILENDGNSGPKERP